MKKYGASVISIPMPDLTTMLEGSSVIDFEFKEDLAAYLAQNNTAPVHSLQEIFDGGLMHSALEATFKRRLATKGRASDDYLKALAKRAALQQSILKLMDDRKLDALVYPTIRRKPAPINEAQAGSTCQLSASTGFPAISMPAGFTPDGLPVGVELLGRAFDDAKLVAYAYAYEQATHHRKAPSRTPALGTRLSAPLLTWQSNSAKFTFDLATSNLTYNIKPPEGELLAATLHRVEKDGNGPAIAVLKTLTGTEQLSNPDRERLMSGGLYLRIATRSNTVRIPLKPQ
jgi:amidase